MKVELEPQKMKRKYFSVSKCTNTSCYHNGIGTTKDLGSCYHNGIGTTKDEEKAFLWYLKSAEGGNITGQCSLGYCYDNGIGTIKDEEKAFQWYLKSAEGGNLLGQDNLGSCYQYGIGTTKDEEKAFQWYLKSAEGGDHGGQFNLGSCYDNGIGTTKDKEKAFQWYLKSAEGGDNNGQCNLGYCYQYGMGTTKDEEKAFQWYLKSAEGRNHMGQNNIGYCYQYGIGTAKDFCEMPKWTSGNNEIDKIIQMTQSDNNAKEWEIWRWINYSKFKNIKYLAKGGFGTIWKAEWIDMPEELFEFYKSNQIAFKKLKNSQEISSEFLKELIANFQCRNKYILPIFGITQDPMTKEYADSQMKFHHLEHMGYCHILHLKAYDSELAADIFNGLRPKINRDTPQCWVELMKKCWHKDPAKRPNAEMIFYTLEKWIDEMSKEKTEHLLVFLNANEKMKDEDFELSSAETTHSEAYLISHLLPSLLHIQPSSILGFDINKLNFNFNDN
ncbi:hypothetical protein Glove_14g12 [Diversispora epigaea]|uniref:Tyrosine-protein kinase catalytic domain-containing protein n=1 Tax=Diversispora epigaea TaxID=1348612 RepID=A0A397JX68_9GLOM|nr:hypothetical protein Glove_14g12 [Diversispora epigaea]